MTLKKPWCKMFGHKFPLQEMRMFGEIANFREFYCPRCLAPILRQYPPIPYSEIRFIETDKPYREAEAK